MSAHWLDTIKAIGRDVAFLFWTPRPTTWQRTPPLLLEAPKQPVEEIATEQQTTGEISMAKIFEGMFDGVPHYYGPPGTRMWTSMEKPYRRPSTTGKIAPQNTGPMSPIPPTPRDTDGIQQLPPREDRKMADVPTDKKLPLEDLVDVLPNNALPVMKIDEDHWVRHLEPTDDLLAAMRKRDRYQLQKPPIYDLPTVVTEESRVRQVLEGLPLPSGWYDANVAEVEVWDEPEPAQKPEPTQSLTQEQKQAKEATLARIEPGLWQLQLIAKYKKECEEK